MLQIYTLETYKLDIEQIIHYYQVHEIVIYKIKITQCKNKDYEHSTYTNPI